MKRKNKGCGRPIISGYWNYCGEISDMGQNGMVLCKECGGEHSLENIIINDSIYTDSEEVVKSNRFYIADRWNNEKK